MSLAAAVRRYVEGLSVTQGEGEGEALRLYPWERRFLRGALVPGRAVSALSIARGNGKTTLCAAIAAAALAGPLRVRRGEVVIVASSFGQSRIAFEHVRAFLADRIGDRSRWRVADSYGVAALEHRESGARVRCIASDPRRAHGLAPSLVLCDEPAQWPPSSADRMFAALRTSLGKVPGSRLIALGTRPATGGHFFSKLLDGGADYAQQHRAPDGAPITHRATWVRANPSLPFMPNLEAAVRAEAREAVADPSLLPSFEALRLNKGLSDAPESVLVDARTWAGAEGEAERSGAYVMGVDLGGAVSWSAAAAFWPETGRLEGVAVTGSEPPLSERARRDGVDPALYAGLEAAGELVTAAGKVPDPRHLLEAALERFEAPPALISCDRWRMGELSDALAGGGWTVPVEPRGQGFKDGGEDVRLFRRALLGGRVRPVPSGLLTFAMAECRTQRDPAGNEKLTKRRYNSSRDDPAAAAVLAVAAGERGQVAPAPAPARFWAV